MSKWARSARVRRVSSHAITAASLRARSARSVMSSRLPIGVATTKRVPRGLRLGGLFLGFGHEERPLVGAVERREYRGPPDELGNEAVLQQVLRLDHRQEIAHAALLAALDVGAEAHARPPDARLDDLLEPDERAAAEEEHVRGVHLDEL